ncbi:hypothetical protein LLH23_04945 [bacterium]|nr:hypothetical protein [bacterium]
MDTVPSGPTTRKLWSKSGANSVSCLQAAGYHGHLSLDYERRYPDRKGPDSLRRLLQ